MSQCCHINLYDLFGEFFNGSDTKKVNDKRHQPFEIETFFVKFERFIETSYLEGENCFGKNALEVGWSQVATR